MPALFVRRERWTLTWTARLLVLAFVALLIVILARGIYGFLAVTSPVGGEILVVEGWIPTYGYREAAALFKKGGYRRIIAAGVVHEDWDESDRIGGQKLVKMGISGDLVATTFSDEAQWDRTFHGATTVKQWLHQQGLQVSAVDIVTMGLHARRSRLLYEIALGNEAKVGVIALEDRRYDPSRWWRSSVGVRTVIGETIGYLYVRLFFSAPR
jgi:uncharacterized SAM-binding protein YcdF (DUF218 family)